MMSLPPMNERKQKLEEVFHAAAELDSAEERERYLTHACAGDPQLRREIEGLLEPSSFGEHNITLGASTGNHVYGRKQH